MICDCVKDLEKRLSDHYRDNHGAGVDAKATCLNVALVLDENAQSSMYIPFSIKGSGKGYTNTKGKVVNMFFSYCPFCGKKVKPDA